MWRSTFPHRDCWGPRLQPRHVAVLPNKHAHRQLAFTKLLNNMAAEQAGGTSYEVHQYSNNGDARSQIEQCGSQIRQWGLTALAGKRCPTAVEVAACAHSHTGRFLAELLVRRQTKTGTT